jgi:copper chaperone CopZ
MSCGGCSGAVTKALNNLEGVDKFDVSLEAQKVTVESATLSEVRASSYIVFQVYVLTCTCLFRPTID